MAKKNNTPAKPKLPPEEALFQALSLCRKAGALTMGFDAVEDACVKSKAWLVMVASDASAKTVQRLNYSVGFTEHSVPHVFDQGNDFFDGFRFAEWGAVCFQFKN